MSHPRAPADLVAVAAAKAAGIGALLKNSPFRGGICDHVGARRG